MGELETIWHERRGAQCRSTDGSPPDGFLVDDVVIPTHWVDDSGSQNIIVETASSGATRIDAGYFQLPDDPVYETLCANIGTATTAFGLS